MISPNSLFKLFWNILILFLAVYTAIMLPIRLAFISESKISLSLIIIDVFTDVVFIIDILLNFFFVEEDANGELITD